jgi:hypothetical protein
MSRSSDFVGVGQPLVGPFPFLPGIYPTGAPFPIGLPTAAPSPSLITRPVALPARRPLLQVGPKKAWWWIQAYAISCPTCPKKVAATVGPLSLTATQAVTLAANYQKSGTQVQIRRQRRADEPDAGAWYYVIWPNGTAADLEALKGSKV